MRVIQFQDPIAFSRRVWSLLLERECENCLMLGMLNRATAQTSSADTRSPLMLAIESDSAPIAVAMQDLAIAMVVSCIPNTQATDALAHKLLELDWPGEGFVGPAQTVDPLAEHWCQLSDQTKKVFRNLRLFQLTQVIPPRSAGGRMVVALDSHLDLATEWVEAFCREVGEPDRHPRQTSEKLINEKRLFLWEHDNRPCSMTLITGPTPNGMRVTFVYTPPELRGRGYASNLVAAVSQHLLDSGRKFCFLNTDLANPTSNRIYQQIGYHPLADFRHWRVVKSND